MLELYTYWSFTLNNPTDSEMVLVRNPNQKYIREFVWTPEVGEKTSTPHIQGWLRLQRNNSKAFVIKLYPRASFRGIGKDEYNENTHAYAQKTDVTTNGLHTISLNDPIPNADTQLYKVLREAFDRSYPVLQEHANDPKTYTIQLGIRHLNRTEFFKCIEQVEGEYVEQRANLEKIFVSASYEKMKAKYWRQILTRIYTIQDASNSNASETTSHRSGTESVYTSSSSSSSVQEQSQEGTSWEDDDARSSQEDSSQSGGD